MWYDLELIKMHSGDHVEGHSPGQDVKGCPAGPEGRIARKKRRRM
jgi:hypothetical protein